MNAILKSISGHFDRSTDTLWFSGELVSGARFDVGFPIAHVAVTFDNKMAALNFVADPVCAGLISVDGFLGNYEAVCNCDNGKASKAAQSAYETTMGELADHAVHYAAHAHDAVLGSIFSKAYKAAKSTVSSVAHTATAPARAAVNVAKAAATGKNVVKAATQEVKSYVANVTAPARSALNVTRSVASGQNIAQLATQAAKSKIAEGRQTLQTIQARASLVPGVGTVTSMAIGATEAGLSGKSLTEIVKAAGVSAIPGGPLAQQIAKAGINTVQAGVEGKNMLKAAATQAISSVASVIPDANARALVQRVALDAAAGKNVLSSVERASVDTAINMIPDPTARDMARQAISGNLNPTSVLPEFTRSIVSKAVSPEAMRTLVSGSVDSLTKLGTQGTGGLKTAASELIEVSFNFVPDAAARATLKAAVASAMQGHRVGAVGPVAQALGKVTDLNARALLTSIVQGKSDPAQIIKSADPTYLATLVTHDPNSHLAKALVQGQSIVSGPSGITAPVRKVAAAPSQASAAPGVTPAIKVPNVAASSPFRAIGSGGLSQWRQQLRG
jgi:hypothetical protein